MEAISRPSARDGGSTWHGNNADERKPAARAGVELQPCPLQAATLDELMRSHACSALETPYEVKMTERGNRSQIRDRQGSAEVRVDELDDSLQSALIKGSIALSGRLPTQSRDEHAPIEQVQEFIALQIRYVLRRSVLVTQPIFSPHIAAGM